MTKDCGITKGESQVGVSLELLGDKHLAVPLGGLNALDLDVHVSVNGQTKRRR